MRLITLLIILLFPVIILSFNFLYLVANKNVYSAIFEEIGVYENFQSQNEVEYLTDNLLGFFRGENLLEQNFFSTQAVLHLSDVKSIINTVEILTLAMLFVILALLAALIYSKKILLVAKSTFLGSILSVVLTILISLFFLFNFSFAFEIMHLILFRNNLWLFDASDSLIKLFPESFFVNFAIILVTNIIITACSLFALSRVFKDYD